MNCRYCDAPKTNGTCSNCLELKQKIKHFLGLKNYTEQVKAIFEMTLDLVEKEFMK